MRICVTGATGFIASALLQRLETSGYETVALARRLPLTNTSSTQWIKHELIDASSPFNNAGQIDALVHLAGRAHITRAGPYESIDEFRRINVDATTRLARSAALAGIRRLIFVSTIGVHGAVLKEREIITEASPIDTGDAYTQSKYEAEESLRRIAGLGLTVLRPALVVGAGSPGNLERLTRMIASNLPLLVPSRDNARSFVSLRNLIDLLQICLENPAAIGQTFLAADDEWPSTRQVIHWIAEGMSRRVLTIPISNRLLKTMAALAGKRPLYEKIYGTLRIDAEKARQVLGWKSSENLSDAFHALGSGYMNRRAGNDLSPTSPGSKDS